MHLFRTSLSSAWYPSICPNLVPYQTLCCLKRVKTPEKRLITTLLQTCLTSTWDAVLPSYSEKSPQDVQHLHSYPLFFCLSPLVLHQFFFAQTSPPFCCKSLISLWCIPELSSSHAFYLHPVPINHITACFLHIGLHNKPQTGQRIFVYHYRLDTVHVAPFCDSIFPGHFLIQCKQRVTLFLKSYKVIMDIVCAPATPRKTANIKRNNHSKMSQNFQRRYRPNHIEKSAVVIFFLPIQFSSWMCNLTISNGRSSSLIHHATKNNNSVNVNQE